MKTDVTRAAVSGVGLVPHKVEIAAVAALAEGFCAPEVGIRKLPVIDNVGMAEHGAELHQILFLENVAVNALPAFKMEAILRIIQMPKPQYLAFFCPARRLIRKLVPQQSV